jgi:hypothetical protein
VRCADARSAQIGGPDDIVQVFQVSRYSNEPFSPKAACNLLSKDRWNVPLHDESKEFGPEMSLVFFALLLARAAERLARAGSGPDGPVIGPARHAKGQWPAADPRKEMTLHVPPEIVRLYVRDAALVHMTGRQVPRRDQVAEPLRGIWIVFVKINAHRISAP